MKISLSMFSAWFLFVALPIIIIFCSFDNTISIICCNGLSLETSKPTPKLHDNLTILQSRRQVMTHMAISLGGIVTTPMSAALAINSNDESNKDDNTDNFASNNNNNNEEMIFLQGAVVLPPNNPEITSAIATLQKEESSSSSSSALYITCRPDRPDNVPVAILNGTRGKPPPVLISRISNPTSFPINFTLTSKDLTIEAIQNDGNWWKQDTLICSARWDSDGIAATRSPNDLVGRGISTTQDDGSIRHVTIPLQGRGSFGKFVTGGK